MIKNFLDIPLLLLPLVLPLALGYFSRTLKLFNEKEVDALHKFVVKMSVPFLIFKSLYKANMDSLMQMFPLAGAYTLLTILFTLLVYYSAPYVSPQPSKQNAFAFSIIMGNYAFLGWGVAFLFYGESGLTRAVFFTTLFWPIFLLCGFWLVQQRQPSGKGKGADLLRVMVKNAGLPLLITALAIILNIYRVTIPLPLWGVIDQFAGFTIPLILYIIGLNFKIRTPAVNLRIISIASFVRLIFGFGLGLVVVAVMGWLFPIDNMSRKIILMEAAMPHATLAVFFTPYIDIDRELLSSIIAFATMLSLVTMPMWLLVVEHFFN